jgi:hypothetical protein
LLHVGQSKTGTTSIQSTLFWRLRDSRHLLLSLDSFFGNQLLLAAFADGDEARRSVFLDAYSEKKLCELRARSLHFLDRGLAWARARELIPILSAEAIWRFFSEDEIRELRDFLELRGFQPRVFGYLRAPWDWLESSFQQMARIGQAKIWDGLKQRVCGAQPKGSIECMDRVFGRENVALHFFNPEKFPGECVVRHFCEANGIPMATEQIVRDNESLNLNALRFVHAYNCYLQVAQPAGAHFLRRSFVIQALADLPGPMVRLHRDVAPAFNRPFLDSQAWLQERLGCDVPETLVPRGAAEGLRSEDDLRRHGQDALDWLGRKLGRGVVEKPTPSGILQVAEGLQTLVWRSPSAVIRVVWRKARLRFERSRQRKLLSK